MDKRHVDAFTRARLVWHVDGMSEAILGAFADYQRAADLSETTIRNRASILRGLERTIVKPLTDATVHDLRRHIGRPTITASSRRTERNALIAFYTFLVDDGLLAVNPAARLPKVHVPKGEPRPFTAEQIDAMLTSGAYRRTRAMILLGYYQGFRVSSIARVRGDDLDLGTMTIRTVAKGGKERVLPLHPMIAELAATMPTTWWFPARAGRDGHVSPTAVTNLITKAKLRAGISDPTLSPHSLRHAYATDMVEEGVDVRVVQELMMHESLSSTQIYTRVSERRKREGIAVLAGREIPAASGRRRAA